MSSARSFAFCRRYWPLIRDNTSPCTMSVSSPRGQIKSKWRSKPTHGPDTFPSMSGWSQTNRRGRSAFPRLGYSPAGRGRCRAILKQSLDRLEAVRPWHDHADRPAALQGDLSAIEPIGHQRWRFPGRRLLHPVVGKRGLEELGRVVVVEPPEVNPADVIDLADAPDQLAQRHALPEPLADREGNVVGLHSLQVLDAV